MTSESDRVASGPPVAPGSRAEGFWLLGAGALALGVAWLWRFGESTLDPDGSGLMWLVLAGGVVAACFGSRSGRGLGLGAGAVPLMLHGWGARGAALAAVVLLAVAYQAARYRRRSRGRPAPSPPEARPVEGWSFEGGSIEEWAGIVGSRLLAVAGAGAVWRQVALATGAVGSGTGATAAKLVFAAGLAAGLVYLAVVAGAETLRWATAGAQRGSLGLSDGLYELAAWSVGVLAVAAFDLLGRGAGLFLVGVLAAAALDLARLDLARARANESARRMREVHLAGHRIIFGETHPLAVARLVYAECRRIVPFSWFQLILPHPDGSTSSWFAAPDGVVAEGEPQPPPAPPALPGIHRSVRWEVLERDLSVPERKLGALRLWCDPRRLETDTVGWLDTLLPEIVSAVHGALLDREAREDALTGLPDRRQLEDRLLSAHRRSVETGTSMAVIMLDLDHFKKVNDRYGHATGDEALKAVASVLEAHRREPDTCCRYGGEEFAVVLAETDGAVALQVAERLRHAVEELEFAPHGRSIPLRISAGVAAYPELHVEDPSELVELADEAMYRAKTLGRNLCLLAEGRGGFRAPDGRRHQTEDDPAEPEIPTLFA